MLLCIPFAAVKARSRFVSPFLDKQVSLQMFRHRGLQLGRSFVYSGAVSILLTLMKFATSCVESEKGVMLQ